MYEFINLIKAIAACLVVNSHFDGIWPISALATGGSIGNCLFFASTGFLLANIKQKFGPWYLKKLARIYPAIIIVESIGLLFFNANTDIWGQYGVAARYFVCGGYWFLQALVCLYIPYYIVMTTKLKDYLLGVSGVVTLIYFVCYFLFVDKTVWSIEASRFKWIFYFGIMLIGSWYALQIKQQKKILNCSLAGVITIVMFIAFYGFKFLLDRYPQIMPLQFIEHVILAIFIYALMAMLLQYEAKLKIYHEKIWWKSIKFLSRITLEIYLVMDLVIEHVETFLFPISFYLACGLILVSAFTLHAISKWISDKLIVWI